LACLADHCRTETLFPFEPDNFRPALSASGWNSPGAPNGSRIAPQVLRGPGGTRRGSSVFGTSTLQPPGYFFLGPAESLYQVTGQFRMVHFPEATSFLKPAPAAEGVAKP
jgi:hypothetical protein